jgi:exonuclease SbcC
MSVRLEGFRIRGFGPFDRELAVDLSALSATDRLVAICGENGAGKTTSLELALPGAMYRETPTRGSLVELATARDAFLETRLVNGQPWTIRHLVDKVSGKSEVVVLDADGAAVLPDSKVTSFDRWAAQHMPAPEVFFASVFAPQSAAGFLGAKAGVRKEILLRILGPEVQRLEQDAERAREQLKAAKAGLATLEARIADERGRGGDLAFLNSELVRLRGYVAPSESFVAESREKLAAAEAEVRRIEQRAADDLATSQRGMAIAAALEPARHALDKLETKIRNNRGVLADAETIRAAAARLPELRQEIERARAEVARLDADARRHGDAQQAASREETAASQRTLRAESQLQGAAEVEAAVKKLPGVRKALAEAESDLAREEQALRDLRATSTKSEQGRISELRGGLKTIGSGVDAPSDFANAVVADDDAQVALAERLPREIASQEAKCSDFAGRRRTCEQALRSAEAMAARQPAIDAARAEIEASRVDMRAAVERRMAAGASAEKAARARDDEGEGLGLLTAELADLEPKAAKSEPLSKAEARLTELEPLVEPARREIARLETELAALPQLDDLPAPPDLAAARHLVSEADEQLATAHRGVAQAEQRLAQAQESAARIEQLETERAAAEAEVADWTRLAADLGRDGLQAMVIDQAIPELNETTNDLLHAAFGPRFTIDVRTQTADAKGRRMLETLDIWVIDTGTEQHKGREGLAETLSGGEKTIVAEALSLALTTLACRQAGVERPTLIRDESAGALSAGNAPVWMAMLRRAADIINVDRILFVNHDRQTWDLADARIWVGAQV